VKPVRQVRLIQEIAGGNLLKGKSPLAHSELRGKRYVGRGEGERGRQTALKKGRE